jgi:two-component system sensor histidine kinase QseC
MNSIRGRLLLYLVPALLVIYSLTAWRVLTVTAHEAEEVFDAELAHFARIVLNLTHHELQEEQKKPI